MATTLEVPTHRAARAIAAGIAVAATFLVPTITPEAATAAAATPAYGWPVKPFHRQHPIRGSFGDPRIGGRSHSFHFGVDVSCPDGTPVYATITGRAYISPRHRETVTVIAEHGDVEFGAASTSPRTARSSARSPLPGGTCTSPSVATAPTSTHSVPGRWAPTQTRRPRPFERSR